MTYVHGLGDAQEKFALDWDRKYGWIDAIEVKCPHCGSTDTPREGFEQTDSAVGAKNGDLNVLVKDAENSLFTSIILIILIDGLLINKDTTIWLFFALRVKCKNNHIRHCSRFIASGNK